MDRDAAEGNLSGQLDLFAPPHEPPLPRAADPVRHALLEGRLVEYRFVRARRRTIGIAVDASGLSVRAPLRASFREIDAFVHAQGRWILARLAEWAGIAPPRMLQGVDGEPLPLAGREVRLALARGRRAARREDDCLRLSLPFPERRDRVLALLRDWLRHEALAVLAPRAARFGAQLGVQPSRIALSSARQQWGVCTARGEIRLNWRLVHVEPALADYVVAHEVAHLVELNHSARFWKLLGALYPDWREARERLERAGASLPFIGR